MLQNSVTYLQATQLLTTKKWYQRTAGWEDLSIATECTNGYMWTSGVGHVNLRKLGTNVT